MEILFAATELAPLVKVGGLADVVAALSKSLRQLGHKVTLAMPRFPALKRGGLLMAGASRRSRSPWVTPRSR